MDEQVLINKTGRGQKNNKNTSISRSGGENAAKATEGLMKKHKDTNEVISLPSRDLDHKAGLTGEVPRCGCPFTVGRKPSVIKGKKLALTTGPDSRTTT